MENTNKTKLNKFQDLIKKINLKNVVKAFTLIWGLILIVLMTITNVGLNKSFDVIQWLSNSLIIFGIMVFGLLMGESIGSDTQRAYKNGLFQSSLNDYNSFYKLIEKDIIYFDQFYQWFMPQELYNKKLNYLISEGVDISKAKNILKYCDSSDLYDLKQHAIEKENNIHIRKLQDYEVDAVERVLNGSIKLNLSKPNYYLTAFGNALTGSILEEGKEIAKTRKVNKQIIRVFKIIATLSISLIWGVLTVYDFINADDTQAWFNLVSRITALFTSLFSGYVSSVSDVKLQAQAIINKIRVLTLFKNSLDKKLFIAKDEKELADLEYNEYKEKIEKAKENVVMPELVLEIENKGVLLTNGTNGTSETRD